MRSKERRRMSVARLASGEGVMFSFSSRASTKASIGLRSQRLFFTAGGAMRCGGSNAQCCVRAVAGALPAGSGLGHASSAARKPGRAKRSVPRSRRRKEADFTPIEPVRQSVTSDRRPPVRQATLQQDRAERELGAPAASLPRGPACGRGILVTSAATVAGGSLLTGTMDKHMTFNADDTSGPGI